MRLVIRNDEDQAAAYVANYIVERINTFEPSPAVPFVLGLPTGSTPLGVYERLVEAFRDGRVSFANVVTFNMDEYVGLPRDHPESYHTFMWRHFFSHVDIRPQNVHLLDGNAADLEQECLHYEDQIRAAGGIDLFLAGIGEDGHIAFNEPGSSLVSRTRVKTLAYDTIRANSRFFGGDIDAVPRCALSVGVQTVLDAREVVAIVLGPRKALALQKCIEEGINHMWTLSSLQLHPHPMVVCDEDATLELRVKTVKYFKSIEQVARTQGFEQTLPTRLRTRGRHGANNTTAAPIVAVPTPVKPTTPNVVIVPQSPITPQESPILTTAPPITASLTNHVIPVPETASSSTTNLSDLDDLVPDRMGDRIPTPAAESNGANSTSSGLGVTPVFRRRLTPTPEQQTQHFSAVGA